MTGNDTNASWVEEARSHKLQGNGHHTLSFRANGAPVYAKGANMIPMESLEGRYVDGMHRQLVISSADAGMNMLRVWGGGIYPFDEFLDACDERGVLVFEDMMYGTDGIMPGASATPNQEAELRHQVRRMGHHPSVVAWSGCNECGGMGVYTDFVMTTVASEDRSRPVRSSCPWVGYETGIDILTGFPNGQPLKPVPAPAPAPPPPTPAPSPACTFDKDIDFHPDSVLATTATNDPVKCCADCAAASKSGCVAAVLYSGKCYLKAATDAKTNYSRSGRIACVPKKKRKTATVSQTEDNNQTAGSRRLSLASLAIDPHGGAMEPTAALSSSSPFPGGDDIHGPYQHGGIFPARNGGGKLFPPPVVDDVQPGYPVGATQPGYFRTETGCSVLSSFESMSATLSTSNWGLHSAPFHERNYPCDPIILSYFNSSRTPINLDKVSEASFKKQLYLCMLGAGLQRKADIESWRSGNIWGTLLWQLGEIWPTGGWGSLEYGNQGQKGQVSGGRWKPLHYFMRQSAYADVVAACGNAKLQLVDAGPTATGATKCFVKNDSPRPFTGTVSVELVHFADARTTTLGTFAVDLGPGAGAAAFFCPDGTEAASCPTFETLLSGAKCETSGADCAMRVVVHAQQQLQQQQQQQQQQEEEEGEEQEEQDHQNSALPTLLLADNLLPLAVPSSFVLPKATVTAQVVAVDSDRRVNDHGGATIELHNDSPGVALYVWLSTLANGRFSDNGFFMGPGTKTIDFIAFGPLDEGLLTSSLRVEHLGEHLMSEF